VVVSVVFGQTDTVWTRRLSGTGNGDTQVSGLAADSAGYTYALVQNLLDDSSFAITIAKLSPAGELAWSRRFDGNGFVSPEDIAVAPDGGVVVVGTLQSMHGDTAFALKYTSAGESAWVRTYNHGGYNDRATAVAFGPAGEVYVAGYSDTGVPCEDILLVKYSAAGTQQWTSLYDHQGEGDYGRAVLVAPDGSVYVGGGVNDWEGGDHYEMQVLKYSPDSTLLWARTFDGPWDREDSVASLALDGDGNLFALGCASITVDSGGYLLVKYSPAGDTLWSRYLLLDGEENAPVGLGGIYTVHKELYGPHKHTLGRLMQSCVELNTMNPDNL
jgi:hypothetical protein